jgi:hypothetical protein
MSATVLFMWILAPVEVKHFFFEKRSKKLLIVRASASPDNANPDSQRFFAYFFQKRSACFA